MKRLREVPFSEMKDVLTDDDGENTLTGFYSGRDDQDEAANNFRRNRVRNSRGYQPIDLTAEEARRKRRAAKYCAICTRPFELIRGKCLDHDHETGEFRGVICIRCNVKLGFLERLFKEPSLVIQMEKYLNRKITIDIRN